MPFPQTFRQAQGFPVLTNIDIVQGSTYEIEYQVKVDGIPQNLSTPVTVNAAIKSNFTGAAILTFTGSVVDAATGIIRVRATPANTAALTVPGGTPADQPQVVIGFWDLDLTDGTDTVTVARGTVNLIRQVA